jgi:hypothetical protein
VGNDSTYIQIPLAIVNSASTSMATGASYITAEYSFTALGNGVDPIMNMAGNLSNDASSSNPSGGEPGGNQ